jgi:simple sugar transport system ATP-binding protein
MAEPILEVRHVTKLFGSVIALSDVSAKFYPGEVTCLLGDNGAAKPWSAGSRPSIRIWP